MGYPVGQYQSPKCGTHWQVELGTMNEKNSLQAGHSDFIVLLVGTWQPFVIHSFTHSPMYSSIHSATSSAVNTPLTAGGFDSHISARTQYMFPSAIKYLSLILYFSILSIEQTFFQALAAPVSLCMTPFSQQKAANTC